MDWDVPPNVGESSHPYLGGGAKGCGDARSGAPHTILDLLHGLVAECPERTV
jgi:hypothetical protein